MADDLIDELVDEQLEDVEYDEWRLGEQQLIEMSELALAGRLHKGETDV